jgi:hypothetical protein
MRGPSKHGNPAWFAVGVVLAAILAPAATIAATSLVQIQGPSGTVAAVDMAHQLLVGPAAFVDYFDTASAGPLHGDGSPTCEMLVPAQSKALIVRQVQIDVAADSPGQGNFVALFSSTACSSGYIRVVHTAGAGPITVAFDPGYRIPAGSGIAAKVFGASLTVNISVSGYRVPAAAVP